MCPEEQILEQKQISHQRQGKQKLWDRKLKRQVKEKKRHSRILHQWKHHSKNFPHAKVKCLLPPAKIGNSKR